MYNETRQSGFGSEVKRRILMGTYALSAGYYDAIYKRAQQVQARPKYSCIHSNPYQKTRSGNIKNSLLLHFSFFEDRSCDLPVTSALKPRVLTTKRSAV